ncbi:hypothetical protein [Thiorhodovibrio frisius]|uniref:Uncharacterized protein n=1 Tax=Thiorhodovibrio frisius TaxID=631362 RepID=H8Z6F8_9GAMM|nr:hypothetical protein [Thiorhodovibrio frisius]EIC20742.1 hypothetical protein Thi970DRAFT_04398 [Thiorhodovibrio frisius]WPL21490.1 hypothetical protein Thiofri_01616 [Thiorhodovibrio frisius]
MKTSLASNNSAGEQSRNRVSQSPSIPPASKPVARDIKHVEELIAMRRSVSLRLKRTGRETDRVMLESLDNQLALHRIDIPTVKQWLTKTNR